jgi:hypothetical protein
MRPLYASWNALVTALALATMLGCQGLSTSKPNSLTTQNPPPGALSAVPASVSFGSVPSATSQTQSDTLSNTGGTSLTITQVTVTGEGFSVTGLTTPLTLTPGQSTSFNIAFEPQSSGNSSGNIAIASNASDASLNVALSGSEATQSQGTLSVSPVSVGSITVGTSGTQTGTLSASGTNVSVSSVSLGGTNPSEFSITGLSFPVTVTTSQPVPFTVTFTPGATGTASATASFTSNASNSPGAAALTGTGAAAPVHAVTLSWTASTTSGVTSYNIFRAVYSTNSCGAYSNIGSTPSSATTYTDSVVADGTTYCYATTAVDPSGQSGYSNITQAVIPPP